MIQNNVKVYGIGDILKKECEAKYGSVTKTARTLGINQSMLSRYVRGICPIIAPVLNKLIPALGPDFEREVLKAVEKQKQEGTEAAAKLPQVKKPKKKPASAKKDEGWAFALKFVRFLEERGISNIAETLSTTGMDACEETYKKEVSFSVYQPGEIVKIDGISSPAIVVVNESSKLKCLVGNKLETYSKDLVRHTGKSFEAAI